MGGWRLFAANAVGRWEERGEGRGERGEVGAMLTGGVWLLRRRWTDGMGKRNRFAAR